MAAGLHRLQDRPGQAAARALRRDARPRCDYAAEQFAELRKAGRRRRRHRHRLPRRHQPGHWPSCSSRRWSRTSRCSSRSRVSCQNHDVMAEIARGTHLPIATGERVFTKWGFREVLEKKAATILQPDLCHAGGITEVPADRRHGRGVLRRHRPAQPARARSRWPPASSSPRRSRTSSARSRSASARAT